MFKKRLKDYFVPHEGNNYAPNGLEKAAMVGMLFLVVLSFTASNMLSILWMSSQWMVSTVLPAVIVELTNDERNDESLVTLRRSSTLDEAARLKAKHMAKNAYFAHYSPDGVSPWYWFGEARYNFVHAGENLAIHFTDSGDVVEAWMDSPTHRANIMNGNYTEIGVGTAEGTYEGFETVYVVQLFGTPAVATEVEAIPEVAGEVASTKVSPISQEEAEVLSEAVTLTELVTTIEAPPMPTTEEIVGSEPEIALIQKESDATSSLAVATSSDVHETEVVDIVATEQGVILYSDFLSTSTTAVPATMAPETQSGSESTSFLAEVATQPHKVLQILYIGISAFVLCSLLLSILIEVRRQQPVQIAYAVGLLSCMFLLLYVHLILSSGAAIV